MADAKAPTSVGAVKMKLGKDSNSFRGCVQLPPHSITRTTTRKTKINENHAAGNFYRFNFYSSDIRKSQHRFA